MGHPVPFLLAPQETRPITAIIAITANKTFFFIVKGLLFIRVQQAQRYNLHYQH